jgi:hypothetical protein
MAQVPALRATTVARSRWTTNVRMVTSRQLRHVMGMPIPTAVEIVLSGHVAALAGFVGVGRFTGQDASGAGTYTLRYVDK